jgi:hypothetical protein
MGVGARVAGTFLIALALGSAAGFAFPSPARENEQKLQARLDRERNPVKKAKLEVRLGRLKLRQAFDAYDRGDFKGCWKLFDAYLERMQSAWTSLAASGRQASRKPDGFKQLDIALRESRRSLADFETRVTFAEREQVEKIKRQTEQLRSRVLDALFPQGPSPKKKNRNAGRPRLTSRRAEALE